VIDPMDAASAIDVDDDDGPEIVAVVPSAAPARSATEATHDGLQLRRSGRDRRSTLTYVDGHAVLKTNNYVVRGVAYHFEAEGDANPRGNLKRGDGPSSHADAHSEGAGPKRIKTCDHPRKEYAPSPPELQRIAHNDRIRASKEAKQGLRRVFLREHVETLRPFLADSVYQSLNSDKKDDQAPFVPPSTLAQPMLVTGGTLRDYQLSGLRFMAGHHERNLGIILGDEMGTLVDTTTSIREFIRRSKTIYF
jgi:hypothetical protein